MAVAVGVGAVVVVVVVVVIVVDRWFSGPFLKQQGSQATSMILRITT